MVTSEDCWEICIYVRYKNCVDKKLKAVHHTAFTKVTRYKFQTGYAKINNLHHSVGAVYASDLAIGYMTEIGIKCSLV